MKHRILITSTVRDPDMTRDGRIIGLGHGPGWTPLGVALHELSKAGLLWADFPGRQVQVEVFYNHAYREWIARCKGDNLLTDNLVYLPITSQRRPLISLDREGEVTR